MLTKRSTLQSNVMLKKFTLLASFGSLLIIVFSFKGAFRSAAPPDNVSGAPGGGLCTNCHTTNPLNTGGGGVTINGLPTTFQPGQTYPFSVTISHGTADRTRWGFEINARNSSNDGIGTFTPGPNTAIVNSNPSEIGHQNAVFTPAASSYTYTGMSWTAPGTVAAGDNGVRFYIAGNAANGNGANTGDFIYTNTTLVVLPITLKNLNYKIVDGYKVAIDWQTSSEAASKEFVIEKSDDDRSFYEVGLVAAAGNSANERSYGFTDAKPSFFNQPVYYRLKLVDLNGQFRYSKTIQVVLASKATYLYSLSPNPARDFVIVGITSDKAVTAEVSLVSPSGSLVQRQMIPLQKGSNNYRLSTASLPHGLYYLRFGANATTQTVSLVVE